MIDQDTLDTVVASFDAILDALAAALQRERALLRRIAEIERKTQGGDEQ